MDHEEHDTDEQWLGREIDRIVSLVQTPDPEALGLVLAGFADALRAQCREDAHQLIDEEVGELLA